MLRNYLPLLITLILSTTAAAQVGRIQQTTVEHADNRVDALTVTMKPERKDIQKAFDDWIDDRYDINMKGGGLFGDKNMRRAEAVNIPAISTENITLYTKTEETGGQTRMTVYASKGNGNFFEDDDYSSFTGLEDVMDNFLSSYLPEYYEERVAEAVKEIEDLRKDRKKTNEDITDNEERIVELKKENEELRTEIDKLDAQIEEAEKMLDKRKQIRKEVNRQVTGRRD